MKGKVFSVLLRRAGSAGDYSCADGELASLEGADIISNTPSSDGGNNDGSSSGGSGETGGGGSGSIGSGSGDEPLTPWSAELPVAPVVEFSLKRGIAPGWHSHPDMHPGREMECSGGGEEAWGEKAAEMLSALLDDAARAGLFAEPFLVLCALRLADGSRVMPSPPVLLIPNSEAPMIGAGGNTSASAMTLSASLSLCSLQWRITLPEDFDAARDGVTHLDLFVSSPIPLFVRKGRMQCLHRAMEGFATAWQPEKTGDREAGEFLGSVSEFMHVGELSAEQLADTDGFAVVSLLHGALSAPASLERYTPDYAHLQNPQAAGSTHFSGRTTVFDLSMTLPAVPPLGAWRALEEGAVGVAPAIEVVVFKEGRRLVSSRTGGAPARLDSASFPRWLFFPEPDAVKASFVTTEGSFTVALRRHKRLWGAFYWCGTFRAATIAEMGVRTGDATIPGGSTGRNGGSDSGGSAASGQEEALRRDGYRMPAAVWRSEKGSRLFPDRLLMQLDTERVIALCRAFRASGLVATTAPTAYLFAAEGIYLLKEAADGSLLDAGLIGAYVLRDASSFRIEGRVLEFVTASGELMRIEGTTVKSAAGNAGDSSGGSSGSGSAASRQGAPIELRGTGAVMTLTTRPLKLGNPETRKRISAVELRGKGDFSSLAITLEGSPDLRTWHRIASSPNPLRGIWAPRYPFFRITLTGPLPSSSALEALSISN